MRDNAVRPAMVVLLMFRIGELQSSGFNGVKRKEFPFSEESRAAPGSPEQLREALARELLIARRPEPVSMSSPNVITIFAVRRCERDHMPAARSRAWSSVGRAGQVRARRARFFSNPAASRADQLLLECETLCVLIIEG